MRKPHYHKQHLSWLYGLALVVAGCANPNPASPSRALAPGGSETTAPLRGGFPLCHVTGNGTYVRIEVNPSAVPAHRLHGDGEPGVAPFDGNCVRHDVDPPPAPEPPPDPQPLTLSCGAPAGATHPGSTEYPGPTVNTIGGVYIEFAVTASPASTGNVWMLMETVGNFSTGVHVQQSNVLLTDGKYEGRIYTSGSVSFVREIRFTLDNASCSLFWNINPQ